MPIESWQFSSSFHLIFLNMKKCQQIRYWIFCGCYYNQMSAAHQDSFNLIAIKMRNKEGIKQKCKKSKWNGIQAGIGEKDHFASIGY